jgi:predicted ester cyclase
MSKEGRLRGLFFDPGEVNMIDELKALSRRVVTELYNDGDLAVMVGYRGREGARRFVEELRGAFSALHFDLVGQIAEDDSVVNLLIMNGMHTGLLLGHIPPSGREVVVIYAFIHRFEAGKLVEGVIISDQLSLMQQIGIVPTPVWAG